MSLNTTKSNQTNLILMFVFLTVFSEADNVLFII